MVAITPREVPIADASAGEARDEILQVSAQQFSQLQKMAVECQTILSYVQIL